MRTLLAVLLLSALAQPARALSDRDIAAGFGKTVFGAEYTSWGWRSMVVKKFAGPVRVYIDNRAAKDRRAQVERFVRSLPKTIRGLDLRIVDRPERANYRIFIVDRVQYAGVVSGEIYRSGSSFAPGRCLVRVVSRPRGIRRADAVIVSDEGEFLFRRCLVEEVLQGLGPLNDDASLSQSVFNDASRHAIFTHHDRLILNMLYDPRVRAGMTPRQVAPLIPALIRQARQAVR